MKFMDKETNEPRIRAPYKKSRFYIANEFVDKSYMQFLRKEATVYFALARHARAKGQFCFPSYELIMRETGIKSRTKISRSLKILEMLHMITVRHSSGRRSNEYQLLDCSKWLPLNSLTMRTVATVLKPYQEPSQKHASNSLNGGTGSVLRKSAKEIPTADNKDFQKLKDHMRKQPWYKDDKK